MFFWVHQSNMFQHVIVWFKESKIGVSWNGGTPKPWTSKQKWQWFNQMIYLYRILGHIQFWFLKSDLGFIMMVGQNVSGAPRTTGRHLKRQTIMNTTRCEPEWWFQVCFIFNMFQPYLGWWPQLTGDIVFCLFGWCQISLGGFETTT